MLRISPVESNTQSNIMEDAFIHIYFAAGKGVKYYDQPVCLSVCLSALISKTTRPNFTRFSLHVTFDRGSVFLWRQWIRYVLPVLWMTWCFHCNAGNRPESKTMRMFHWFRSVAAKGTKADIYDYLLFECSIIKKATTLLPITSTNVDRFSQLFHRRVGCKFCSILSYLSKLLIM